MNMEMRLSALFVLVYWIGTTNSFLWVTLQALFRGTPNTMFVGLP